MNCTESGYSDCFTPDWLRSFPNLGHLTDAQAQEAIVALQTFAELAFHHFQLLEQSPSPLPTDTDATIEKAE